MRSPDALRGAPALRRLTLHALSGALLLSSVHGASAGACGDDIGGLRVPCACGDQVVTDAVLSPTDPVVTEPCSGDGLVVEAAHGAESITLHLGGQSLRGRGHGTGIRVTRGGSLGAVIVGGDEDDTRAEVANFTTGIRANGRDVLREIRAIDVHDNTGDGLHVRASGVALVDVRSEGNGRTGVSISGHGNQVSDVTASSNARDGLRVRGSASTVDATTTDNLGNGAAIGGRGNRVDSIHTGRNGGAGVLATGSGHDVGAMSATQNAGGNLAGRQGATE